VDVYHDADDAVRGDGSQVSAHAPAFRYLPRRDGGEPGGVLGWVSALGEEGVARVLAEAGRPAQGRAHGELGEGEHAHGLERHVGPAQVRQSAQFERRFAEADQQDDVLR